jgi:SNF2 family DNA or RNA helicase
MGDRMPCPTRPQYTIEQVVRQRLFPSYPDRLLTVEDQASDRAHRIGQTRPVTVYRLVATETIEEKIVQLHHAKRDLADSLLEGTDTAHTLTADELIDLLRNR